MTDHELLEVLARMDARQERIEATLHDIRNAIDGRPRGPRDSQDIALFPAIAAAVGEMDFTSKQLFGRAAKNVDLRNALTDCDLTTPRQLGQLLRRLEGTLGDSRLTRVRKRRDGIVWRLRVSRV